MTKVYDWDLHEWLKTEKEIKKAKEEKHDLSEYPDEFDPYR